VAKTEEGESQPELSHQNYKLQHSLAHQLTYFFLIFRMNVFVFQGGVFAGDDYFNGFVPQAGYTFGVRDAVDEFFGTKNYRVQATGYAFPKEGVFQQVSLVAFALSGALTSKRTVSRRMANPLLLVVVVRIEV